MGFQLNSGEPLIDGIRRIALGKIDITLGQLTDPTFDRDTAIHNARKSCKWLRAILRLIRDEVGYDYYRRENICFRDASRLIAPARDSAVMIETLDNLLQRFQEIETMPLTEEFPANLLHSLPHSDYLFPDLREKLVERHHIYSKRVLETDAISHFISQVRKARLHVPDWPIHQESFNAISGGLHRVYRRGRHRMTKAAHLTNTESLHDWRKRVKYLYHQIEVIQLIRSTKLTKLAEALHTLSSQLGNEHDLAELQQLVLQNPRLLADSQQQQLITLIDYRRKEYQAEAWALGNQLYVDKPNVFVNRLRSYWNAWRKEFPDHHKNWQK